MVIPLLEERNIKWDYTNLEIIITTFPAESHLRFVLASY